MLNILFNITVKVMFIKIKLLLDPIFLSLSTRLKCYCGRATHVTVVQSGSVYPGSVPDHRRPGSPCCTAPRSVMTRCAGGHHGGFSQKPRRACWASLRDTDTPAFMCLVCAALVLVSFVLFNCL